MPIGLPSPLPADEAWPFVTFTRNTCPRVLARSDSP